MSENVDNTVFSLDMSREARSKISCSEQDGCFFLRVERQNEGIEVEVSLSDLIQLNVWLTKVAALGDKRALDKSDHD